MDLLEKLHNQENDANTQLGKIDKELRNLHHKINVLEIKKKKVAYYISNNMKFRHKIINERHKSS